MADEKNTELDDLAFELYAKRMAMIPVHRNIEAEVIEAYRKAEAFIAIRKKIRAGGVKAASEESAGADCCAPNLRPTHPHNLVSQRLGDLAKVNRIKKFFDDNPMTDSERGPDDLAVKLNRTFPDLGWDVPTINVARSLFPAYCKS